MIMELWMNLIDPYGVAVQTQEAWIPLAIAAFTGAGSLYGKYKERKDAEKMMGQGNQMTEQARQQSMAALSPQAIQVAMDTYFPGLVGTSGGNAGEFQLPTGQSGVATNQGMRTSQHSVPGMEQKSNRQFADTQVQREGGSRQAQATPVTLPAGIAGRAEGGPVNANQPYVVGEQGPEIMTPDQPGTVTPNPATVPAQSTEMQIPEGAGTGGDLGDLPATHPGGTQYVDASPGGMGANEMLMGRLGELLMNPGDFSTADYERRIEGASQGYQDRTRDLTAQSMAGGIDPGSGVTTGLQRGAAMQEAQIKGEAARDQQLLEQQLKRADIAQGSGLFFNMMAQVMNLVGQRAQAAGGTGFSNTGALPPSGIYDGVSQFGDMLGDAIGSYNKNKKTP